MTARWTLLSLPFFLSVLLAATSCGDSTPGDAAPTDGSGDATDSTIDSGPACDPLGDYELTASDGVTDPLAAPAGTARAGRLSAADLPDDPSGLLDFREGDFVVSNGRVAYVISSTDNPGQVYDPYGGRVVALGRVSDGAFIELGDYNLMMQALGRFALGTEEVAVLSDGSDGGAAVVRAIGHLVPIRALADLLDILVPGDYAGLPAAVDFSLDPDRDLLSATLHVRAPARGLRSTLGALTVFMQGNRTAPWRPGHGFETSTMPTSYVAFDDPRGTSFAWRGPDGVDLEPLFATNGVDLLSTGALMLDPCAEGTLPLGELVAGGPGLEGLQRTLASLEGTTTRAISGSVMNADGSPASDVRLHLTTADDEHLTRFWPAEDGTFSIEVDARAARLYAYREGQPLVGPIPASGDSVDVTMPAVGQLRVTVQDAGDGTPLPSRIEVFPSSGDPDTYPESLGERPAERGRLFLFHPTDGEATAQLLPGDYRIWVTRGPEYERAELEVTIVADAETARTVDLTRVVPTPGVLCADYHIHTSRSIDSPDAGSLKIASLVGDGLEIAIRSDHEWVNDFQPVIDDLGLGAFARGLTGIELTTFTWGHFGVFPLVADRSQPSGGAFFWYDKDAPVVFDEVRARPEAPALIINHPRAGGIRQAYFTEAGYDPLTGMVTHPELWDEEFTIVEVFNSDDFEAIRDTVAVDWFSLLNQGRRIFAVGSSDSHDIRSKPAGWPRTCLAIGTDDPATLTPQMVRDTTEAGHSTISGGIYMTVEGPDASGPGDTATGVGSRASFEVRLFAAPHVTVDRLEVIVDGETREMMDVLPSDAIDAVERARATIEVDVAASGSWVVFHASGSETYDTEGHRGFVVSNPVFLMP